MGEIDDILEESGLRKCNMEASLELARLISEETGLCCNELGQLIWSCYRRLEGES